MYKRKAAPKNLNQSPRSVKTSLIIALSFCSDPYFLFLVHSGGFYSDTRAHVNNSCRHCVNGTFVHYSKAPGKSPFDCKACPEGILTPQCNCISLRYFAGNLPVHYIIMNNVKIFL